jgi:hypothetical protein
LDLAKLNVELAKLAVHRGEKRELKLAKIEENASSVVKEADEQIEEPKDKEEFKVELARLKAQAKESKKNFKTATEKYASLMVDCKDKELSPEQKIKSEGKALLASLDKDVAKRKF